MVASYVFDATDETLSLVWSTSSPAPDRRTFTVSFWQKLANENASIMFSQIDATEYFVCGGIGVQQAVSSMVAGLEINSATYDYTAWHHIVIAVDTPNGTGANRIRLYLDGTEVGTSTVTPTVNLDMSMFANGADLVIGETSFGDGTTKFAFIEVVEGAQLTPSAFAFSDGGTWTAAPYVGSYGNYGFRLDGTSLTNDTSGNGLVFTATNLTGSDLDNADLPPHTYPTDNFQDGEFSFSGLGAVAFLSPSEILRPVSDGTIGAWRTQSGSSSNLYATIDEASPPSDADYITSEAGPNLSVCTVKLGTPTGALGLPATVRVRMRKLGDTQTQLRVRLLQGVVEIASWTYNDISDAWVTEEESLSPEQLELITDASDLYLEFRGDT